MRPRKVNDNDILQLLREGKNQKQIAEALDCSNVAIHKRLKKILPKPKSLYNLTEKEQKFCVAVVNGKSRTQAVMEAYDVSSRESAKTLQNSLMQKDNIKIAIQELMQIYGLTKGYRIHKLKNHVDHVDPVISLKALDLSWKLDGSYIDNREANNYPNAITLKIIGPAYNKEDVIELTDPNKESIGSENSEIN